jgi:hypothetical protein
MDADVTAQNHISYAEREAETFVSQNDFRIIDGLPVAASPGLLRPVFAHVRQGRRHYYLREFQFVNFLVLK